MSAGCGTRHLVELRVVELEQEVVQLRRLGALRLDACVLGDERRQGRRSVELLEPTGRRRLGLEGIALLERRVRHVLLRSGPALSLDR